MRTLPDASFSMTPYVRIVSASPQETRKIRLRLFQRPNRARRADIAGREDNDVDNPYIVIGCLKPWLFLLLTAIALLAVVDFGARHIFNPGHISRVQTIHSAH
jgi:hypothetical protein